MSLEGLDGREGQPGGTSTEKFVIQRSKKPLESGRDSFRSSIDSHRLRGSKEFHESILDTSDSRNKTNALNSTFMVAV